MCNKRNAVNIAIYSECFRKKMRVDACIASVLLNLDPEIDTLGSCCGHGRYSMSIVYRNSKGEIRDMISGALIPRKKRFYKKDKDGYYFIPEAVAILTAKPTEIGGVIGTIDIGGVTGAIDIRGSNKCKKVKKGGI